MTLLASVVPLRRAGRVDPVALLRGVPHGLRRRFSSVEHLPADPRCALIGPGRFGEQPSRVRLPALVIPPRRTLLGAAAVRRRLKKRR